MAATIVPFDTSALRDWAEYWDQPPLDRATLERYWRQIISDLLAAADRIDQHEGAGLGSITEQDMDGMIKFVEGTP